MISLYFSYALGIPLNYSLIYRSQNMVSGQMLTFKIKFIYLFYLFAFFPNILTILFIHSCAKVMQAKCPNFVLCSRELSTKVRAKIRGVSSDNSLEQRAIFRRIFGTSQKIRDN